MNFPPSLRLLSSVVFPAWGESVRTLVGTVKRDDPSARYVSYYTDNGSAHYYNPVPYANYRDAIMAVYNQSLLDNIPIRSGSSGDVM